MINSASFASSQALRPTRHTSPACSIVNVPWTTSGYRVAAQNLPELVCVNPETGKRRNEWLCSLSVAVTAPAAVISEGATTVQKPSERQHGFLAGKDAHTSDDSNSDCELSPWQVGMEDAWTRERGKKLVDMQHIRFAIGYLCL